MAGAMERALDTAVTYAGERKQFGRPIGKFQAVQQNLAVLAGQMAAPAPRPMPAIEALSRDDPDREFLIAIAKTRVGDAATLASEIAHQVHGAIGFTKEYSLQLSTRRLWSWREESAPMSNGPRASAPLSAPAAPTSYGQPSPGPETPRNTSRRADKRSV